MRVFPLINRGLTLLAIVPLVLLMALAALFAGAQPYPPMAPSRMLPTGLSELR